jgi:hypothetical protein
VTLKAFLFLFVVTIVAVVASATIAERFVDPGFERGIVIAVLSSLVVFPAARWAEYRGWIKGSRRKADAGDAGADPAGPPAGNADRPSGNPPSAGNPSSPGDPR